MTANKGCPVCGSSELLHHKKDKDIQLDFFQSVKFSYDVDYCSICGYEGEANDSYPLAFSSAKSLSDKDVSYHLIEWNRAKGIKDSYFERSFGLPARTLNRWRSGSNTPSATGVTLLKLVNTFSWLTEVAEYKYDQAIAKKIFLKNALEAINEDRLALEVEEASAMYTHECGANTVIYSYGKTDLGNSSEAISAGEPSYTPKKVGVL